MYMLYHSFCLITTIRIADHKNNSVDNSIRFLHLTTLAPQYLVATYIALGGDRGRCECGPNDSAACFMSFMSTPNFSSPQVGHDFSPYLCQNEIMSFNIRNATVYDGNDIARIYILNDRSDKVVTDKMVLRRRLAVGHDMYNFQCAQRIQQALQQNPGLFHVAVQEATGIIIGVAEWRPIRMFAEKTDDVSSEFCVLED